jgi:hypothetical protein
MIMAAAAKLQAGALGAEAANEIGHICVCGTYQRIRTALQSIA